MNSAGSRSDWPLQPPGCAADASRAPLPIDAVREADLIGFFLPMHTATRLFPRLLEKVRQQNPRAHLCAYGLYAPLNEALLRRAGVQTVLGGEFEQGLTDLAARLSSGDATGQREPLVSLERQQFLAPDRAGLPPLGAYAHLMTADGLRTAGYTEASRGCKHVCRHCPVVPVYNGRFRIVQPEVVLEDVRRQVAMGARHITFGDPDFFNGPAHALRIVEDLHAEWPELTYDVTIKVEHLLRHCLLVPRLKETGCAFVTTAAESLDDSVLARLEKGHTRADFIQVAGLMRDTGLPLAPTFIPFTPWTTWDGYLDLLRSLVELDMVAQVAPIQLAIRLLIPEGSRLLELSEVRQMVQPFDHRGLVYPWHHSDRTLDEFCLEVQETIKREEKRRAPREQIFRCVWDLAGAGEWAETPRPSRATIPYLTEPWYC